MPEGGQEGQGHAAAEEEEAAGLAAGQDHGTVGQPGADGGPHWGGADAEQGDGGAEVGQPGAEAASRPDEQGRRWEDHGRHAGLHWVPERAGRAAGRWHEPGGRWWPAGRIGSDCCQGDAWAAGRGPAWSSGCKASWGGQGWWAGKRAGCHVGFLNDFWKYYQFHAY